jgi:hypothetical protein
MIESNGMVFTGSLYLVLPVPTPLCTHGSSPGTASPSSKSVSKFEGEDDLPHTCGVHQLPSLE